MLFSDILNLRRIYMNSLEIMEFKKTLETYISEQVMPCEVKRMVVSEILQKLQSDSQEEAIKELRERGNLKDGETLQSH